MMVNKMCISCGKTMTEEEAEEHKEANDCPSIDMVDVPEANNEQ